MRILVFALLLTAAAFAQAPQTAPPVSPTACTTPSVGNPCVSVVVAKADATAQAASIGATTMYTVPAGQGGTYRYSCYVVVTQAATTSSVMPQCGLFWTDNDTSQATSQSMTSASTSNTIGTNSTQQPPSSQGVTPWFNAKAGTAIQYQTSGYASVGATPMQYAIHVKLEYLGQ